MDYASDKIINGYRHIKYSSETFSEKKMLEKSKEFYNWADSRRSVREFSSKPVSKEVIENIIKTASTAPSGAHKQPWIFCAVSNKNLKSRIKIAAEKEEKENYETRMSERWKEELRSLGTDEHKPFLETAPWLIVVFKKAYELDACGEKQNNYYVNESVGIACGFLIAAIHNAGLATLTHTPSPMNFLTEALERPSNERAYLLLPVGYAADPVYVPGLHRKSLDEISEFYE
ncbi:MAG: nitroreductase family protein [Gillisia sp.]